MIAPEGYVILDSDSSQIEARTLAWLAGQNDLVQAFEDGEDVYKIMASAIYNKPVEEILKGERFVGKTTILGAGYGMGAAKFQAQLKNFGVEISVDEAKRIIAASGASSLVLLDAIADFRELTDIKIKAGTTGLLMIGGGVPKNFIQDTVVCAEILGHDDVQVHKYAVQITVADVRDGACSSSTLQEAASWGKVNTGIEQMVFAEAGSVMPLLASDAWHRQQDRTRAKRRWGAIFD
jgi:hypothetical protein